MMVGIGITLIIWGAVCLAVGIVSIIFGVRYFRKGKGYHDTQKSLLMEAEKRVKLQYNKIATLSPNELTVYLGGIFSRYMELNSELGVKQDPEVRERLYASTLAETLNYIGKTNIEAIEYYYGEEYIEKWATLAYRILEKHRQLGGLIDGVSTYDDMERVLNPHVNEK